MTDNFTTWWSERFSDVPPLGWMLRQALPQRWLRVHSLPESKRYPETEDEYAEVLQRQEELASRVLGASSPCWVVIPSFSEVDSATRELPELPNVALAMGPSFSGVSWLGEGETLQTWIGLLTWEPGACHALRRAIIDDQTRALWVSERSGEVFAPYDGGIDVIVETQERRDELKVRYRKWLSALKSGL